MVKRASGVEMPVSSPTVQPTYISLGWRNAELNEADLCLLHLVGSSLPLGLLCENNAIHQLGILYSLPKLLEDANVLEIYIGVLRGVHNL